MEGSTCTTTVSTSEAATPVLRPSLASASRSASTSRLIDYSKRKASMTGERPQRVSSQRSLMDPSYTGGSLRSVRRVNSNRALAAMINNNGYGEEEKGAGDAPFRPIQLTNGTTTAAGAGGPNKNSSGHTRSHSCGNPNGDSLADLKQNDNNVSFRLRKRDKANSGSEDESSLSSSFQKVQVSLRNLLQAEATEQTNIKEGADNPQPVPADKRQVFASLKPEQQQESTAAGEQDSTKNNPDLIKADLPEDPNSRDDESTSSSTGSHDEEDDDEQDDEDDDSEDSDDDDDSCSSDSSDSSEDSDIEIDASAYFDAADACPTTTNRPKPLIDVSHWSESESNAQRDESATQNPPPSLLGHIQKPSILNKRSISLDVSPTSVATKQPTIQKPSTLQSRSISLNVQPQQQQQPLRVKDISGANTKSTNTGERSLSPKRRANRRAVTRNADVAGAGAPPRARSKSLSSLRSAGMDAQRSPLAGCYQPRARDLQPTNNKNADWVEQKPLTKKRMSLGNGDLLSLLDKSQEEGFSPNRKANRRSANRSGGASRVRSKSCNSLRSSLAGCNLPRAKDLQPTNQHNADWVEQKPLTKKRMSLGHGDLLSLLDTNRPKETPPENAPKVTTKQPQRVINISYPDDHQPAMSPRRANRRANNRRANNVRSRSCSNLMPSNNNKEAARSRLAGRSPPRARNVQPDPNKNAGWASSTLTPPPRRRMSLGSGDLKALLETNPARRAAAFKDSQSVGASSPKNNDKRRMSLGSGDLMALLETNPAKRAVATATRTAVEDPQRRMSLGSGDLTALLKANAAKRAVAAANTTEDPKRRISLSSGDLKSLLEKYPVKRGVSPSKSLGCKPIKNTVAPAGKTAPKRRISLGSGDLAAMLKANAAKQAVAAATQDSKRRISLSGGDLKALLEKYPVKRGVSPSRSLGCKPTKENSNTSATPKKKRGSLSHSDLTTLLDPSKFSLSDSRRALEAAAADPPKQRGSMTSADLTKMLDPSKFSLSGSRRQLLGSARSQSSRGLGAALAHTNTEEKDGMCLRSRFKNSRSQSSRGLGTDLNKMLDPGKFSLSGSRRQLLGASHSQSGRGLGAALANNSKGGTDRKFSQSGSRRQLLGAARSQSSRGLGTDLNKMLDPSRFSLSSSRRQLLGSARSQSSRGLGALGTNNSNSNSNKGETENGGCLRSTFTNSRSQSCRVLLGGGSLGNSAAGAQKSMNPADLRKTRRRRRLVGALESSGDEASVSSAKAAPDNSRRATFAKSSRSQSLRVLPVSSGGDDNRQNALGQRGSSRTLLGGDAASGSGMTRSSSRRNLMGDGASSSGPGMTRSNSRRNLMADGFGGANNASSFVTGSRIRRLSSNNLKLQI